MVRYSQNSKTTAAAISATDNKLKHFLPSCDSLLINEATIHLYTYCETRRERRALLSSLRKLRTTTVNTEMLSIKSERTLSGFGPGTINMLSLLQVLWEKKKDKSPLGESINFQLTLF